MLQPPNYRIIIITRLSYVPIQFIQNRSELLLGSYKFRLKPTIDIMIFYVLWQLYCFWPLLQEHFIAMMKQLLYVIKIRADAPPLHLS